MTVEIFPSKAVGSVVAPPSKSLAHRALICGALSSCSNVSNVSLSRDVSATLSCLETLGAKVEYEDKNVRIGSMNLEAIPDKSVLVCDESGSTLRFLLPLCLISGKRVTFKGSKRLFERPLTVYENICKEQNILFDLQENSLTVCGRIANGFFRIPGDISSQFITGLLFALPLLNGMSIVEIVGDLESKSYVDMTLDILKSFGIKMVFTGNRFIIYGNQKFQNFDYVIESDCSNSAFFEALNFLGGKVEIHSIPKNTLQGDRIYNEMFRDMTNGVREFNLSNCPDLAPIMFAVASTIGNINFSGTKRLAYKESNRAITMQEELKKFGVTVDVLNDKVHIAKCELCKPNCALLSHNDHRIAMALSVLCTVTGGVIEDAECVDKSYPEFFDTLKSLGVEISQHNS